MSLGQTRHRGPILSMAWKASLGVSSRLAVGAGARLRLPQVLAQVGSGQRILLLFQAPMIDSWLPEIQSFIESKHTVVGYELADGEACKSTDSLINVWNLLQKERFDRQDTIVAVGGGAVSDLS